MTILMMLLTCYVVVARYVFSVGAVAVQETVIYLHSIVVMLGISYTLRQSGHVRVDIIFQKLSLRGQAAVNSFGTLIFLMPLSMFIFWTSLDYVSLAWSLKETSAEPGGLPFVFILKTLIPLMALTLFLQGVAELLRNLIVLLHQTRLEDGQ